MPASERQFGTVTSHFRTPSEVYRVPRYISPLCGVRFLQVEVKCYERKDDQRPQGKRPQG